MSKYVFLIIVCSFSIITGCKKKTDGPYFATGIKIGEVTDRTAIVWVRLTRDSLPAPIINPFPIIQYIDPESGNLVDSLTRDRDEYSPVVSYPEGYDIHTLRGATPGMAGDVKIYYKPVSGQHWFETEWWSVSPEMDYTTQIKLNDLSSETTYELKVLSRYTDSKYIGESITGQFNSAPDPNEISNILFTVSTGQAYQDQDAPEGGFKIYNQMLKIRPDFFVHTGDIVYYDKLAKNQNLARWHWSRTYSLPTNMRFHRRVASYFIKDDHDTWINDCWPGMETRFMGDFTFEQGQQIFLEQVPMSENTYRTFRWGKDLQIWLMEGRDFRSPNNQPDGPEKTIWGDEQKKWLQNTVNQSSATFKILISPTPLVGPDRKNKLDNHSNTNFSFEGDQVRNFIKGIDNMYVVCGDRHWQYISEDVETGIREYSCGPASNDHAGGWSNDRIMPEHKYLNVTGGFLAGNITRIDDNPNLIFTHYDVEGNILNADTLRVN